MVRVKICGITNPADAQHAAACGADALGFIFYPGSPRFVAPDRARCIIADLPPFVTTVGLFVNEPSARIREIADFCGLNVIQLHGDEGPELCNHPPYRVIKALRLQDGMSPDTMPDYKASALLLDASVPGQYGGTGQVCDWGLAAEFASQRKVILAGGLTPANVAEAVERVRPYGVDVSSGVESAAGKKDAEKVAQFIRMAKESI